ncbi:SDAD1, partial [Symbiodinium natans]
MGRCATLARLVLLLSLIHGRAAPDTCQEPDKQVLMQLRNARQKGLLDTSSTFKQLPVLQLFFPFGNPVAPTGNSSGPTLPNVTEQFECVVPIPPGASSDKWVPCLNIAERLQLQQDVAAASSNASQPNLTEYLQSGAWDPAGKWAIPMDFWNDFRCNCPNCADEEELFTAVAYAVQGSLLTLADNFTDYVLDCTSCGGCPSQDQCGAVVDCDPDALALIPSCALKLQEDGWNIDYLHDCGNGFKIPQSYVNDLEYCDCPDCSDEDNFNCSTCNSECPTECGYWALCGSNATFYLNPACQEANILWDARGGYKACNNGWTIPADYWNDEFYCDCPDCEDESFSCEACGGCPNASAACGDYVECYTSDSILPQLNPQCILAALSGWAPAKITSCNASDPEAWNITLDYINDGYCDCPNCEDEDQWTCDNCSVGCPQRCGDSVQCLDEQNFKECGNNEIFGSGSYYYGYYYYGYGYDDTAFGPTFDDGDDGITNLLSKNARTSKRSLKRRTGGAARHSSGNSTSNSPYFVCNNGWTIWADYYDDKEYCDCRDCEDEPDITLESCGIQPLAFCGDYAYCGSGPKEEQGACTYETWQLGDNPVVCSNGWTKPQDKRNNNFCDCPNCEDENETGWNCDNCYCPQVQCIDNGACFAGISSLFGFVGTFQAPPPGTTTPGTTSSPGTTPATTPSPGGTGYYGRYAYKKGAFPWHYWRASTGWQRKNWRKNRGYSLTQQEAQQRAAERKTNVNQERRVLRSMLASEGCNILNCISQAWDSGTEAAKDTYNDVEKKVATGAEKGAAWASGAANEAVKWGTQAGGAIAEWTVDQAIDAATFYRVGAENFAAVVANFAQEGAELAQEAAENAADFFMSAFDTGKEIIIKFLGDQLSNILNEDNLQPRPTFCGGVAFPWLASTVVGDPNNACWKQVIGLTEEIAEFVSDDVGRLVDAVITRVSNMLEDEDLWKAIIGKLGNALITSIGTPGGITATRAVEIYNDIMAVMVTYLKTHLTPLFADLAAFFADVGRFLEAMSERTKNLISAVFDEPNGPFNFLGFQGETWYVALCLEGFTFGMFLGTCLYYPFKFGASDNDYFVVELGWGRER